MREAHKSVFFLGKKESKFGITSYISLHFVMGVNQYITCVLSKKLGVFLRKRQYIMCNFQIQFEMITVPSYNFSE